MNYEHFVVYEKRQMWTYTYCLKLQSFELLHE